MATQSRELAPFIAWDSEGVRQFICHPSGTVEIDFPLCLVGCSTGERIKKLNPSSLSIFSLLMEVKKKYPKAIHVSYSFGYDVNMFIKDLPFRALVVLRKKGACYWRGYNIEYVPRKWVRISNGRHSIKIFDVFLFFNCKFGLALRKYNIGTPEDLERIDSGKEERPNFSWLNIDEIEKYWETELSYLVSLMDHLRNILYRAGFHITSWHGPGALASYTLGKYNTQLYMDRGIPADANTAAQYAMFGGRFQPFYAGYYEGPVYDRDINSAYAYAISRMPNLSGGKWVHTYYPDRESTTTQRMGLYRIRRLGKFGRRAMPLPMRTKGGTVCYPPAVEGWYHAPEAAIVRNDPATEFIEAWIFEDDGTYPFKWVEEAYYERIKMQEAGDPSEKALKWTLAALYGQMAQRTGWERTKGPPKWHQLEWAGLVTAECRAMIYAAAIQASSKLVSIDTDGFISLHPVNILPNGCGNGLGQWKATEYSGLLYLQNGIYWLRDQDGSWLPPKSRGIPRKKLAFSDVLPLVRMNQNLELSQHIFVGFGSALQQDITKWRKWIDVPRHVTFGGNGKASHKTDLCPVCQRGIGWGEALHPLMPTIPAEINSYPHKLPWLTERIETAQEIMEKWGIYDD